MGGGDSLFCFLCHGRVKARRSSRGNEPSAGPGLSVGGHIPRDLPHETPGLAAGPACSRESSRGRDNPAFTCLFALSFFHSAASRVNRRAKLRNMWGVSGKVKMRKAGSAAQGGTGEVMELCSRHRGFPSPQLWGFLWGFAVFLGFSML